MINLLQFKEKSNLFHSDWKLGVKFLEFAQKNQRFIKNIKHIKQ